MVITISKLKAKVTMVAATEKKPTTNSEYYFMLSPLNNNEYTFYIIGN